MLESKQSGCIMFVQKTAWSILWLACRGYYYGCAVGGCNYGGGPHASRVISKNWTPCGTFWTYAFLTFAACKYAFLLCIFGYRFCIWHSWACAWTTTHKFGNIDYSIDTEPSHYRRDWCCHQTSRYGMSKTPRYLRCTTSENHWPWDCHTSTRQLSCILDSCTIAASYKVSQAQKALLLMPRTAKGASASSGELNTGVTANRWWKSRLSRSRPAPRTLAHWGS